MNPATCHADRPVRGRGTLCASCRTKAWREAHPERYRQYSRAYYLSNKTRIQETARERHAANPARRSDRSKRTRSPEREREHKLWAAYGIPRGGYERMLQLQDGRCAICRQRPGPRRLVIDHCHRTGVVRALLCSRCNLMVGYGESATPETVMAFAAYVERCRGWGHADS